MIFKSDRKNGVILPSGGKRSRLMVSSPPKSWGGGRGTVFSNKFLRSGRVYSTDCAFICMHNYIGALSHQNLNMTIEE